MGKSTSVEAPVAPDYAEANKVGIETDINTLPIRLGAEQAAAAGTVWYNPLDNKSYNFGLGTDWGSYANNKDVAAAYDAAKAAGTATGQTAVQFAQNYYAKTGQGNGDALPTIGGDAAAARRNISSALQYSQGGADIQRQLELQRLQDSMGLLPQYNQLNLQAQKDAYGASLDAQKQGMANQMDMELAYRPAYTASELAAQQQAWDQSLAQTKISTGQMADLQSSLLPQLNALGLASQKTAYDQGLTLANQGAQATQATMGQLNAALLPTRDAWGAQVLGDLQKGSTMTDAQRAQVENDVRSGQAARGNILGNSAMVDEALAKFNMGQQLQQQRQAAAQAYLAGSNFVPIQQPNAQMNAQQAVNPLMPNFSAGQMQQAQTPVFQATTTSGPNLSPYSVTQGNQWNYLNPNAGQQSAQFSQQSYGTKANVFNTQQTAQTAANGQMMDMIGSVAGGAMSMM